MHPIPGKHNRLPGDGLFRPWPLEEHLAFFLQPRDLQPHVDTRNAVVIGNGFHRAGGAGVEALLQIAQHILRQGIDKTDIHAGIVLPSLADNPFHRADNLLGRGPAIVHRKFYKKQVRIVPQHILPQAEHPQSGIGPADTGVDFHHICLGVLVLKPRPREGAVALLAGDAAAQIGDTYRAATF